MTRWIVVAAVLVGAASASAGADLRPPYLTQAKPVYGIAMTRADGKTWTYRGDWVMAIFDYDRINGDPTVKRLFYTVCRIAGSNRRCVRRVWRGRPDVWMIRVEDWIGSRRYFDFKWIAHGKQRGTARLWLHE